MDGCPESRIRNGESKGRMSGRRGNDGWFGQSPEASVCRVGERVSPMSIKG